MTVWLKVESNGQTSGYKDYLVMGNRVFTLYHNHATQVFSLLLRTDTQKWYTSIPADKGGSWHHVGLTWSEQDGSVAFYDGTRYNQNDVPGDEGRPPGDAVIIVSNPTSFDAPFAMDELYIWTNVKPSWFMEKFAQISYGH